MTSQKILAQNPPILDLWIFKVLSPKKGQKWKSNHGDHILCQRQRLFKQKMGVLDGSKGWPKKFFEKNQNLEKMSKKSKFFSKL